MRLPLHCGFACSYGHVGKYMQHLSTEGTSEDYALMRQGMRLYMYCNETAPYTLYG